jgi:hypothetical protein
MSEPAKKKKMMPVHIIEITSNTGPNGDVVSIRYKAPTSAREEVHTATIVLTDTVEDLCAVVRLAVSRHLNELLAARSRKALHKQELASMVHQRFHVEVSDA